MARAKRSFPKGPACLCLLILLLLCACGAEQRKNYFYTYMQSDPGKLDPFYNTDVISGRILAKISSGLFTIDSAGLLKRDLAERYSFDGHRLIVDLRKDAFFHDGSPLRADDVVFSFERIWKSSHPTSPRKWVFSGIRNITAEGPSRIRITLKRKSALFLYLLTMPNCYIISRRAFERDGRLITSGPFILREWLYDEKLVLVRNPRYYGPRSEIDGMIFRIIPEDLTARFEFINGKLDYFEIPYLADIRFRTGRARVIKVPEMNVHYIALNNRRRPFDDRSVRRALNMAIDRPSIRRTLFRDRFLDATGPIPPGTGEYKSRVSAIPYDPLKAREILSKAGLQGKEYTLLIKADNQVSLICQMLQHYFKQAGIDIRIKAMEWSALKAATFNGDFDMAYFTWYADYPEPENYFFPLFHSVNAGSGGNRSFFHSREADRLISLSQETLDREKRFDIYHRLERIIVGEAPWIFLWYGDKTIAVSGRVRRFVPYPIFTGFKGTELVMDSAPRKQDNEGSKGE